MKRRKTPKFFSTRVAAQTLGLLTLLALAGGLSCKRVAPPPSPAPGAMLQLLEPVDAKVRAKDDAGNEVKYWVRIPAGYAAWDLGADPWAGEDAK